jgi:hypothetical protein
LKSREGCLTFRDGLLDCLYPVAARHLALICLIVKGRKLSDLSQVFFTDFLKNVNGDADMWDFLKESGNNC